MNSFLDPNPKLNQHLQQFLVILPLQEHRDTRFFVQSLLYYTQASMGFQLQ